MKRIPAGTGRTRPSVRRPGAVILVCVALAMAACGRSQGPFPLPGPAASPILSDVPAGTIVPIGAGAQGVAVDPLTSILAVGATQPNRVVLTDEAGRVLHQVALSGPPGQLALVGPGGPVMAVMGSTDTVAWVSEASGTVQAFASAGHQPHDSVSAAGKMFIATTLPPRVLAMQANQITHTVPAPAEADGLGTDGTRVAVVGAQDRKIRVFDAANYKVVGTASAGDSPSQVVGAGGYFYVVDTAGNQVLVFQAGSKLVQVGHYRLGGAPFGVCIDRVHHKLWITLTALNRLAEFSYAHGVLRLLGTMPTVRQPNSVAVDPVRGWVFVTGAVGGVLEIIHPQGSSPQ